MGRDESFGRDEILLVVVKGDKFGHSQRLDRYTPDNRSPITPNGHLPHPPRQSQFRRRRSKPRAPKAARSAAEGSGTMVNTEVAVPNA